MVQAVDTIDRRVNELGVAEPNIARHGANDDQILVQLPGVTRGRARQGHHPRDGAARIEARRGRSGSDARGAAAAAQRRRSVRHGSRDRRLRAARPGGGHELLPRAAGSRRSPATTCGTRRSASTRTSRPAVMFSLKPDGARKFGQMTDSNIGRSLAIVLDNRIQSYPRIDGRITDEGRIAGNFTQQEAADLSLKLRSGALPASMSYLEERVVGPTLGSDSIRVRRDGVARRPRARHFLHALLLQAFRHQRHRRDGREPGHPARDAWPTRAPTMTLPGIAGFILTIGMGVDSNVLIFERIKEELRAQRGAAPPSPPASSASFLDAARHPRHVAHRGGRSCSSSAPGRSAASRRRCSSDCLTNLFTSIFVSRTLFELILSRRPANAQALSI